MSELVEKINKFLKKIKHNIEKCFNINKLNIVVDDLMDDLEEVLPDIDLPDMDELEDIKERYLYDGEVWSCNPTEIKKNIKEVCDKIYDYFKSL
jgi:hypothetical protein|tara:strand:+ start:59 stop:340 length:282 start_codon:yes stop_codon:yes gene_type:complete